jgi:hypothetical protein
MLSATHTVNLLPVEDPRMVLIEESCSREITENPRAWNCLLVLDIPRIDLSVISGRMEVEA